MVRHARHHHIGNIEIFIIDQIAHTRISPYPVLCCQTLGCFLILIANGDKVKNICQLHNHGQMRPCTASPGAHKCNFETIHNIPPIQFVFAILPMV